MKVAICFSGGVDRYFQFPNSFVQQLEYYKNFEHCELFFSHWSSDDNNRFLEFIHDVIPKVLNTGKVTVNVEFTDKFQWQSKYGQQDCHSQGNSPAGMFSMYGGIKNADAFRQAYEKENGITYDFVLRSRPDIHLVGNIDFARELSILKSHKIVMFTKNWHWLDQWTEHGMLNDQWFMAEPNTMAEISTLVDNIDSYVDLGCRFHPESLLWWHVKNNLTVPASHQARIGPGYAVYGFIDAETRLKGHHTGW